MNLKQSWGRTFKYSHDIDVPQYSSNVSFLSKDHPITFFGQGRSYGDVALNNGGTIIDCQNLNRFISANWNTGVIKAEGGTTLEQIIQLSVPNGWFLPVTPGTKFVSLAGAVANDVHGKNHHIDGSIGAFIKSIELVRSDGETLILSNKENQDLFNCTISGLGLTGFIKSVEIQLIPIKSTYFNVENYRSKSLDHFFELSDNSVDWQYSVYWLDCFAQGNSLGRGIFTRAAHVPFADRSLHELHKPARLSVPIDVPKIALNRLSISAFNYAYFNRPSAAFIGKQHYGSFLYPLDGIRNWNRLYGSSGFYQYQCILPRENAKAGILKMLKVISDGGMGSFLAVLKNHGKEKSPGKNTFSLEGTSLALDFPNRGDKTSVLFKLLDEIVLKCQGRLYPAKDSHMSPVMFQSGYPNWRELNMLKDPAVNSAFWQRVTGASNE